jgi:hypothetical protein
MGHFCFSKFLVFCQMKAIEKLISGKEIDLEELEGRANQTQIQKVYANAVSCSLFLSGFFMLLPVTNDKK